MAGDQIRDDDFFTERHRASPAEEVLEAVLLAVRELEGEADVFLTQQAMADMLGARRTSVTRVLGDPQRERLIAVGYGRVTLLNREGLAALASAGLGRLDRPEAVTRSRTRGAAA